jgi:rod shape-determining protein MreD
MMLAVARVDRWVRNLIPAITTFILLTITILPLGLGAIPYLQISLPLMAVVYWSLRAPAQFPLWLVFTIGVLADLLEMTPLGLQALLFMAVPLLVRGRRRVLALRSFPVLWLIFAAAVLAQITLFWLVAFAGSGMAPAGGVLYLRALASMLCFPLLVKLVLAPAERLMGDTLHG